MAGSGGSPSLFPLPLLSDPFQPRSRSRRLTQRFRRALSTTQIANQCIIALNSLSSSFASPSLGPQPAGRARNQSLLLPPFNLPPPPPATPTSNSVFAASYASTAFSNSPSALQSRALVHIYGCARRFVSRRVSPEAVSDDPFFDINFLSHQLQQSDLVAYAAHSLNRWCRSSPTASPCPLPLVQWTCSHCCLPPQQLFTLPTNRSFFRLPNVQSRRVRLWWRLPRSG